MISEFIGALDIGGTKIAATVAGAQGVLARVVQPTLKTGTRRALGDQAISMLDAACEEAGFSRTRLNTVGVSSCGPFVLSDGMITLATPNICGGPGGSADLPNDWVTIPLEHVLRERYTQIQIRNDCVAALVAERMFGAAQNEDNCIYATWSTGIGFGLCVDGHILHGKNGNAGHAGHMLMSADSAMQCGCGNRGDLEGMISGRNLANHYGQSSAELFAAAEAMDPHARAAIEQAAQWFGKALYNLSTTLDTRLLIIGGSIWTHHGHWLEPLVMQEISTRFAALTQGIVVAPAALGELVTDIGALGSVMPAAWIDGWRKTRPWDALLMSS